MGRGGRGRGNRARGGPNFKPSPEVHSSFHSTTATASTSGPNADQGGSSRTGRGRGRARGRGGPDGFARGRGRGGRGGAAPGPQHQPGWSLGGDLGFASAMFANQAPQNTTGTPQAHSGANTPRRGRGRGDGASTPRGRGRGQPDMQQTPRRGGYGLGSSAQASRGRGGGIARGGATLSGLLYQDRPLLKPITFVPSVHTRVLFQEEEEIFQPVVEETDNTEQSHAPTADRVARVFSGADLPPMSSSSEDEDSDAKEDEDMEEIEEIDFNNMASLMESTTTQTMTKISKKTLQNVTETQFTGVFVNQGANPPHEAQESLTKHIDENSSTLEPTSVAAVVPPSPATEVPFQDPAILQIGPIHATPLPTRTPSTLPPLLAAAFASVSEPLVSQNVAIEPTQEPMIVTESTIVDPPPSDLFVIDVEPGPLPADLAASKPPTNLVPPDDDEEDIIVYVAPHPRKHQETAQDTMDTDKPPEAPSAPVDATTGAFEAYERPAGLASVLGMMPNTAPIPPLGPIPEPPDISSISFSFASEVRTEGTGTPSRLRVPPVTTPRLRKQWERKRGLTTHSRSKSKKQKMLHYKGFGAFGAMHEEAMLRGEEMLYDDAEDPKWQERRRGDSDLEWGDEDEDEDMLDRLPASVKGKGKATGGGKPKTLAEAEEEEHGMDVDLGLDSDEERDEDAGAKKLAVMQSFVKGMLGAGSGVHKTMGDIEDEEMMRLEDEEGMGSGTSDEEETDEDEDEEAFLKAVEGLVADEDDDDEDDDDEDDDDEDADFTPRRAFQARLEKLRKHSQAKKASKQVARDDDDDSDDDDPFGVGTWADEDEDFIDQMDAILDLNDELLGGSVQERKNRKARKELFNAIRNGEFDSDDEGFRMAPRKRDKGKSLPPDLRAQWEKDRQKKAEYKKQRELVKLLTASDPMAKKKGGRKGKKAMLIAASLDPASAPITVLPNRIIDFTTLIQQIRRFVANLGGPVTMSLPPTSKETRKTVHEIAIVFGLKSLSKGKGDARYITLSKTTRTGMNINENKLSKILRRTNGRGDTFVRDGKSSGGGGGAHVSVRQREGEVVGKAAPKLTESNVGFRMLAMMGWSEGVQIGSSGGGIDAPLTAVIKHTRLGLGANR